MKKLTTLSFLFVLIAGVVEARSIRLPEVLGAKLERINFDAESPLANLNIRSGYLTVDQVKKKVSLFFHYAPVCRPGFMCPRVMLSKRIELPLKRSFRDTRCGIVTYIAERRMMPADGLNETITVVDYSKNRCVMPMHLPYMETSVNYETAHYDRFGHGIKKTRSTFTAEKLEVLPRPLHNEVIEEL